MSVRSQENVIGAWSFLIGVIIAIIFGLVAMVAGSNINPIILGILSLLGLIVGFFVAEKDSKTFLMVSTAVVLVSFAGLQGGVLSAAILGFVNVSKFLTNVLGGLMFLFIPATIVVAVKTVFSIAKS